MPYYSRLFATHQIRARPLQGRADLSRIPVLTKSDIQQNEKQLLAEGTDKATLTWRKASGSTGQPTKVYLNADRANHSWAYNTRHNRWAGLQARQYVGPPFQSSRQRGQRVAKEVAKLDVTGDGQSTRSLFEPL